MLVLRTRVLTAAILIPLMAAGIVYLPNAALALLFGLITCLAAWEWAALAGARGPLGRGIYLASTAAVMWAAHLFINERRTMMVLLVLVILWWTLAAALVYRFQMAGRGVAASGTNSWLSGWLILVPAWHSLLWVHNLPVTGPHLVLALMLVIWSADSAAYFGGRRWGRRRLASRISPGKTWEGAAAALLASVCAATLVGAFVPGAGARQRVALVLISTMAAAFSVVGDLTESLAKRRAGVKDSGSLLPGHGGVLDRIDSLTAAAPVFCLGLIFLGPDS